MTIENLIKKIEGKYPYEFVKGQLLINGDCLEIMDLIDDKSIDLVLTDPPYGMKFKSNHRKIKHKKIINDDNLKWIKYLPIKFSRISKINIHKYIFCSWHFIEKFKNSFDDIKNILIWHKNNTGMGDLKGDYAPQYEMILYISNGKRKLNFGRHSNILKYARTCNELHPTQKPINIISFLVTKSSKKNDLILDAFAGSFTTSIACMRTKRQSICIEKDKDYYTIGVERVKEEARQDVFNF